MDSFVSLPCVSYVPWDEYADILNQIDLYFFASLYPHLYQERQLVFKFQYMWAW